MPYIYVAMENFVLEKLVQISKFDTINMSQRKTEKHFLLILLSTF